MTLLIACISEICHGQMLELSRKKKILKWCRFPFCFQRELSGLFVSVEKQPVVDVKLPTGQRVHDVAPAFVEDSWLASELILLLHELKFQLWNWNTLNSIHYMKVQT
jgi:hypothetical protein